MLHTKCYKQVVQTTLRHLNSQLSANVSVNYCSYSRSKLLRTLLPNVVQCRRIVNEPNNEILLPPLFDDPKIIYPNFFKSLKNQIQNVFILPRLDKDFNMSEFLKGSKQALVIVSNALAQEDYESIRGLVTDETIQSLRNKISMLTPEQKQLVAVKDEDILLLFPYEVGIMFDNDKADEKYAEISVVYHSYRDYDSIPVEQKEHPFLMGISPETRKHVYISNVRFIREFKKDVESFWTINKMNHFMLLSC